MAFDLRVRTAHDPAAVLGDQQFVPLGGHGAIVDRRELDVELAVGADARDLGRGDPPREHQRARGGSAAIACAGWYVPR